jgi:hypothetical protein
LRIELSGLQPGTEHDQLNIAGKASLDGALEVTLIGGFNPSAGNTFDILNWGSLNGSFDTINLPALSPGLMWNVSQLYTLGELKIALAGDYNFNGAVDAADYVVWRKNDGTPAGYNTWRTHFGQTDGGGSAAGANAAVPEPTTLVLLMFVAAGWCLQRGRHT